MARRRRQLQEFLDHLIARDEDLNVEFKRAAIQARDLATTLVAMANTYGGWILVGVENDGTVTGVARHGKNIERLVRAPRQQCLPQDPLLPASHAIVEGVRGEPLLVFYVHPGRVVYCTQRQIAYVRDFAPDGRPCDRPLTPEETARLALSKGQVTFETVCERRARASDLDEHVLTEYVSQRDPGRSWQELLAEEGLVELDEHGEQPYPTNAALLLFGKRPPRFLGRPVVDILRYEGTEAKVGRELNVVKREVVEGPLPAIIRDSFAFIRTQIRERSPLTGLTFDSAPEYPELAWQEAIVNAVAHRDYGILGTPIFVRLFDDRMEIESPGTAVPPNDIDGIRAGRYIHCSRNPQVVRVLKDLGFMRGFAEGIRRMSREMQSRDLHPPEFSQPNHAFRVTLYNAPVFSVDTQAWLRQFNGLPLSGAQRRALALLHRFGQISNAQYRQANQVGREKAVRDLHKLVELDVLVLSGRGSRAHYTLSDKYAEPLQVPLPLDPRQKVLNYVRQFGSIANRDCRELLQLRRPAARKLLQQLVHQGSLRMVGSRRGTRYVLP